MRFADVIGRDREKRLLVDQVDSGRLPHALLLWGAPGTGKLSLARALAQYIHCPHRSGGDSCGVCPVCRQHESLNYPDMLFSYPTPAGKGGRKVLSEDYAGPWQTFLQRYPLAPWEKWLELSGAENSQPMIRVDESEEIIRRLTLGNYGSGLKILLMWLPERLNPAAANKLLKLVEEPQPGRMFIMVSDNPALILPTVYSRLQRVRIDNPQVSETSLWLSRISGQPETVADEASEVAMGNPQKALGMLDPDGEQAEFREAFQDVMRKAWKRDVAGLMAWSGNVAAMKREKSRRFLRYMAEQIRLNYLYSLHDPQLTPMMEIDRRFSDRFAPFIHGGNVEEMMRQCDAASNDIAGNANATIVMFDFALRMIMLIKTKQA